MANPSAERPATPRTATAVPTLCSRLAITARNSRSRPSCWASAFGLLFGASTVYLGLRAGLTVSASIPIAVLAISVLKKLGGSTILENNIVQTIGSAGESVAGGVVFTIPALIFLLPYGPGYFNYVADHAADLRRRHPRRADDGAAAAGAHRQGARRAALSRRHGVRRGAGRRRARRQAGRPRLLRPRRGRAVEIAVVDLQPVPHRDRLLAAAHQLSSRTPRSTWTCRRSTSASAT